MKKLDIAVVVTVAIFTCLLLCTPALADYNNDGWPVGTRESGSIRGGMIVPLGSSEKTDLIVTEIKAYHNNTDCPAWFNLSNEIGVTVKNNGSTPAEASNVSLYIDGEFFGSLPVSSLAAGANETVTFENWKPIGEDCLETIDNICYFNWSFRDYNITAVADCDNEVAESNETNNERSVFGPEKARACYNGYMANKPLENVAHGTLHGALFFTTGDGVYSCLYSVGDTQVTNYDITLPETATVILADLNVYYKWTEPSEACPEIEVSIETTTGTYVLPLERAYNDMNCTCPGASRVSAWGNYVYNLTGYITGSGTYTVTVNNKCIEECKYFCTAAPGIALVYEDENAPLIEYRVNRGADVLLGGRSDPTSVNLCWEECINNATFPASAETGEVANATLGVVSPWGSAERDLGMTNYLFFNDLKLGTGVYHGYSENYDVAIDSISMHVGSSNAQVGVNVTNVTAHYLHGCDNVVGQADDGDNMMPANAFLVLNYKMPDLVITNKTEAFGDCNFTVTYTVANVGDGDADASQTTISINGAPSEFSTPAIAKGESHENTVGPFECACGATLKVIVCADKYDEVDESDETNNCKENEVVCLGKPDLIISEKDETFDAAGNFTITYKVKNIGSADANASQTTIYINEVPSSNLSTPAIAKGESHENTVGPFECPCGSTLNVTVCADTDNGVDESDETNNCEVNIIECPATTRVDIRADGIAGNIFDVSGDSICPGTVTEDGITINNETAMGAVVIYCQNNGINVHITIGALGEYVVQIGNDPADNNNWMYAVNEVALPIGGAQKAIADGDRVHWYNYKLHYYEVLTTLDKTELIVGGNLTATVSWKNMTGTHLLSGASVYVGALHPWGPETGTHVGTTGADGTCTFSWSNPGEWGVYAVDPVHGSGQYNMPYVSFTCRTGGKPDLVINKTVSFSDSTFTVNYTVTNIGIVRANESTTCKYLDGVLMESQSCPALVPGESHKGTFDPEPCPCGSTFNVSVCADRDNVINESDETNNCEVNIITCPSTTRVDLQAEGIAGTIFKASGYSICPGTVTQDGFTIDNETAMGALVSYCQKNDINVEILIFSIGLYIVQIGSDQVDYNNWMYAVNEVPPQVGGDVKTIVDGDRVHWYNYKMHYYAVLTTLDKTEIFVGETITATVTWKGMDGTQPLSGATVYVGAMGPWGPEPGTPVGTTGADGTCSFSWSDPGEWGVYAIDPVHGSGQYNWPYVSFTCRTGGEAGLSDQ